MRLRLCYTSLRGAAISFVEIEDPHKPVFNKDGSFSQAFNHARQQLADWKLWAEKNINTLMTMFGSMFETYNADNDRKDFRFYLVCGRRPEVESDLKRKERWSGIHALDGIRSSLCLTIASIHLKRSMTHWLFAPTKIDAFTRKDQ
jgi:hypothetical protein